MDALATLAIQALFGLLFGWALWSAARHRDLLARDVALVFAPLVLLLGSSVLRQILGELPAWFGPLAVLFLLFQPVFSLQLVADLRGLPRWLVPAAAGAAGTAGGLLVLGGTTAPVLGLVAIGLFVVTELAAAGYLAREARLRSGAARMRLAVAAVATAAVAGALFASGASATGAEAGGAIRVVALVAALAYWIAFLPPRSLRRLWQSTAAFDHTERLLATPATTSPEDLWADLARTAAQVTGAAAVVLVADGRGVTVAGSSTDAISPGTRYDVRLADLVANPGRVDLVAGLRRETGAGSATVVALDLEQSLLAAVVILRTRPSLFDADDAALVRALGVRTAHLVQRRDVLAGQETLSQRLAHTVAALEAASAAKSDFLASMSHELRTPLNAIIGFSSLMVAQPEAQLSVPREWAEHVRSAGDHLLSLINDVLDVAKIEAGRLELAIEPVDVGEAIAASVSALRPLADRKGLRMDTSLAAAVVAEADPGRLRQILYNLLSNAIKYTPDGGSITVTASGSGDEIQVAVKDSGIGIAPDDQPYVFEEFRQVGEVSARLTGTGLGLALTKRLVEAHHGRIELESALGEGSTFTVVLPTHQTAAPEPPSRPAAEPAPITPLGRDVLVIEDEPSSARLLQTYLVDAGYRARIASDGEAGLTMAAAAKPAAIVLDVLLPGIDGWEVLRRLKSDPGLRDVPVIIATVVDERSVGIALGAVDYLVKPIDPRVLLDRLARHVGSAAVRERAVSVLAVDDDETALDVIESTLQPRGVEVRRASSGQDGIRLARDHPPDLVICDLVMPEMDGFEVVARLQANEITSSVPILILTAHDLTHEDKARLNGRVVGIATKGDRGVEGLSAWLAQVLPVPDVSPAS